MPWPETPPTAAYRDAETRPFWARPGTAFFGVKGDLAYAAGYTGLGGVTR